MNDAIITFTGNVTADPEVRETQSGVVATLRVASTQRRFNKSTQEWYDGATTYFRVSCWRGLGSRVAESLRRGDPVFVSGRFTCHTYQSEGVERTSNDVEAVVVGPDLSRVSATVNRKPREAERASTEASVAPVATESAA